LLLRGIPLLLFALLLKHGINRRIETGVNPSLWRIVRIIPTILPQLEPQLLLPSHCSFDNCVEDRIVARLWREIHCHFTCLLLGKVIEFILLSTESCFHLCQRRIR
jgi:hypothetical protein